MDPRNLAQRCRDLLDAKKAEAPVVLDLRKLSDVTDFFVIGTANSEPHLRALVDEITEKLQGESGLRPRARDGSPATQWVVLDYFDVVVHLMRAETRARYDLEGLWGDAPRLRPRRCPGAHDAPAPKRRARRMTHSQKAESGTRAGAKPRRRLDRVP